jgi:hypothetical protein
VKLKPVKKSIKADEVVINLIFHPLSSMNPIPTRQCLASSLPHFRLGVHQLRILNYLGGLVGLK